MAPRDRSQLHVSFRSSRAPLLFPGQMDHEVNERRASKAQRILGTDFNLPNPNAQKPKPRRNIRTPDSSSRQHAQHSQHSQPHSRKPSSFRTFPSSEDLVTVPQNLRVRASSPLLGHEYRSQNLTPQSKSSKKIHHAGSSSTLFSYFSSKEGGSTRPSKARPITPKGLQPVIQNELSMDPHITFKQTRTTPKDKDSKRKIRPPRIDLSILFPKPRNPAPPLFSPQRMTDSPSPVSTIISDRHYMNSKFAGNNSQASRFGEPLPQISVVHDDVSHITFDRFDLLSIPEKDTNWYGQPFERTVPTSEIDLALDRYAGQRSLFSRSSNGQEYATDQRRPSDTTQACSPTDNEQKNLNWNSRLTPEHATHQKHLQGPRLPESRIQEGRGLSHSRSRSRSQRQKDIIKKNSKSTLKNADLQNSSFLCLSSSEDEDEMETPKDFNTRDNHFRDRDVIKNHEVERRVHNVLNEQRPRKAKRAPSNSSHGSDRSSRTQTKNRQVSTLSIGNSSQSTLRTPEARNSGNPIIEEPDILDQFPQQPLQTPQEIREMNRRSRVMAVTRQEEDLLAAMRQRKGKITPSIFHYNSANISESDISSMTSAPSSDSFCANNTSFLRLSAGFPSVHHQGATTGPPSQSSNSDTEQKTGNWIASPQFRSSYSESLPSSATSSASPITPNLPIHRFSPQPSKPSCPPTIQEDNKQHSRRRTDSSGAIVFSKDGPKDTNWSFDFDWDHNGNALSIVR